MSLLLLALAAVLVMVQFAFPRGYAFAPRLITISHFQNVPVIQIGVAFSAPEILEAVGRSKTGAQPASAGYPSGRYAAVPAL